MGLTVCGKLTLLVIGGYYTIVGDEVKIITFVLEFMDHKKYDKVFGYDKK